MSSYKWSSRDPDRLVTAHRSGRGGESRFSLVLSDSRACHLPTTPHCKADLLGLPNSSEKHPPARCMPSSCGANMRWRMVDWGTGYTENQESESELLLLNCLLTLGKSQTRPGPQFPYPDTEVVLPAPSSSVILRAFLQIACGGQYILFLPVWLLDRREGGRRQQESKVNQFQPRLKPKR